MILAVSKIPAISKVKTQKIASGQVAYRVVGHGEPLLMLMGSHMTMHTWDPVLLTTLAQKFKVFIVEYPGIGEAKTSLEFSPGGLVEYFKQFADSCNFESYHVLGYSTGGWIAQELALLDAARVKSLVLIATDCGGEESKRCSDSVAAILNDPDGVEGKNGIRLLGVLAKPSKLVFLMLKFFVLDFYAGKEAKISKAVIAKEIQLEHLWYKPQGGGTFDRLPQLTMPVLIMQGGEDVAIPVENADIIAGQIKQAVVESFANKAHGIIYQNPKKVAQIILTFLQRD